MPTRTENKKVSAPQEALAQHFQLSKTYFLFQLLSFSLLANLCKHYSLALNIFLFPRWII